MNTAIYSPSGASSGIGFAIPVDTVKFIVATLIRDGQGRTFFFAPINFEDDE
jgi:S1-C subfamily serine protease